MATGGVWPRRALPSTRVAIVAEVTRVPARLLHTPLALAGYALHSTTSLPRRGCTRRTDPAAWRRTYVEQSPTGNPIDRVQRLRPANTARAGLLRAANLHDRH